MTHCGRRIVDLFVTSDDYNKDIVNDNFEVLDFVVLKNGGLNGAVNGRVNNQYTIFFIYIFLYINERDNKRYSIIAGSYIGYYSPLICDYSLVVGYKHYGTFDSTTDPDNYNNYMSKYNLTNNSGVHPTILFYPRKFEYCLVVGKQHVVQHDYVSLLGNSQHSKETGSLQTSGKIWCQGGTVNSSDQRIKTDIVDASLDESFNIINSLKVRK